jgi:hypothetical protein
MENLVEKLVAKSAAGEATRVGKRAGDQRYHSPASQLQAAGLIDRQGKVR